MYLKLIGFFLSALCVNALEINGPCETPNQEQAKCVPYFTCPPVYTSSNQAFKDVSLCAKEGKALYVCCGTKSDFEGNYYETIFSAFEDTPEGSRVTPVIVDQNNPGETVVLQEVNSTNLPDRSVCGIHSSDDRIFGGSWAGYDEFPWMAALEYKSKADGTNKGVRCGGSLINNRFVLTAAHCIVHNEFELIHVRLGDWNLTSDPDCSDCPPVQFVKISEAIVYPYYERLNQNNDIALLRLERDIKYSEFIRPICLPPYNLPSPPKQVQLAISGWGKTNAEDASDIKLKASVPLTVNRKCKEDLPTIYIQANQMCAGGVDGQDSCQGDSGGPIARSFYDAIKTRVQWYQEGLVSQGVGGTLCGRVGYPGVYTRISRYISWIEHIVSKKY